MFEKQTIAFKHGENEFVYRIPTVRDDKAIIAKKSLYCMQNGILPDFIDFHEKEYLLDLAKLEICLEKCPDDWREKDGEKLGKINTEFVSSEELKGVLESWRKALQEFPEN